MYWGKGQRLGGWWFLSCVPVTWTPGRRLSGTTPLFFCAAPHPSSPGLERPVADGRFGETSEVSHAVIPSSSSSSSAHNHQLSSPSRIFHFWQEQRLCRSASYLYSVDVAACIFSPLADYPSLRFPLGSPVARFAAAEADKNKRRMLFFLGLEPIKRFAHRMFTLCYLRNQNRTQFSCLIF